MRDLYIMRHGYIKSLAIMCTVLLLSACDGLSGDTSSGGAGTGSTGSVSTGSGLTGSGSGGTGSSGTGSSGTGSSGSGSGGTGSGGTGSSGSGSSSAPVVGSVTISWTPPVARANGAPLSLADISGYRVYYGTASGKYPNRVEINDSTAQKATVKNKQGRYYFVVTTIDSGGRESVFSQELIKTI